MNKISLNEDQVRQLKFFIFGKGIKENDAINEIVDHFACKVEELMNEDIYLSLENAMRGAYLSFGKNGFQVMLAQYKKHIRNIFFAEFKIVFKELLKSRSFLLGLFYCSLIGSAFYYIEINKITNWTEDLVIYTALISLLAVYIYQAYSFFTTEKKFDFYFCEEKNLLRWQKTVRYIPKIESTNLLFIFLFPALHMNTLSYCFCLLVMSFMSLFFFVARKETKKRMVLKLSVAR